MALQMTGRIKQIGATQSIPSKNGGQSFLKQEIILDVTRFDPYTGERSEFENYPAFEFSGDKCKALEGYKVGDVVTISFDLQGSFFKGQDGVERNFTRVRGYKIEAKAGYNSVAMQPQPAQPQPQPQYAGGYPPPPPPPRMNDLPF